MPPMVVPNPPSARDAFIVATTLVHGMGTVTHKVADFQALGVDLLNPWD
jgi:toxin FitB